MKETMSNVDIRLILPELQSAAEGAFIKNVYQYSDVFVLKLYQPAGGTTQLLIQPGKRIHLTEFRRAAPRVPPKFCSVLRKYLKEKRVLSIKQHDFDRIIIIEVGDEEESYKLVAELFGNGNLLLLDPKDTIFIAMRYRRMRDREVVPKAIYEFPPPRGTDFMDMDPDEFVETIVDSNANVVRTLASRLNLDSLSCEEISTLAEVDPKAKISELDKESLVQLGVGLSKFVQKLKRGVNEPQIVVDDENEDLEPEAFLPFEFEVYSELAPQTFDMFSQTIDDFFGVSEMEKVEDERLSALDRERARLQKIIDKQHESIGRLETKASKLKSDGEMIYTFFQNVQEVLDTISKARDDNHSWEDIIQRIEKGKAQGIESALLIEKIIPSQGEVVVKLAEATVRLDIRLSAQDNANKAYEQAKKTKSKVAGAKKQIEKTKAKLDDLDASKIETNPDVKPVKIRKKHWYEKFRWFTSSEGFLVLGGRDVKSNERLAKRQLGPNDVFLHASVHGAPYVIIKVPDQPPGENTIREAAQFAVTFSRAWQDGLSSGDAYWVDPEQVSFSPPSGEYLPAGAIMIYGTKNNLRNVPVELAVGIVFEEDYAIPVSGPLAAIESQTEFFVQISPGQQKKGQLVREIVSALRKQLPEEKAILVSQIPQEDLMRALPAGGGEVIQ
jgi:predicted ribosome quality control (RQC) complex YloA/Tae2 family protein